MISLECKEIDTSRELALDNLRFEFHLREFYMSFSGMCHNWAEFENFRDAYLLDKTYFLYMNEAHNGSYIYIDNMFIRFALYSTDDIFITENILIANARQALEKMFTIYEELKNKN